MLDEFLEHTGGAIKEKGRRGTDEVANLPPSQNPAVTVSSVLGIFHNLVNFPIRAKFFRLQTTLA